MRKTMTALVTFFTIVLLALPFQVDIQKRAFTDFDTFLNDYENVLNQVKRVHQLIGAIEALKAEILDDNPRKVALKKLIDLHPDYDLIEIAETIAKLSTLKKWLEDNEFVEVETLEPPELYFSYGEGLGIPDVWTIEFDRLGNPIVKSINVKK